MNCPACGKKLSQQTVNEVTVDVCMSGCHGIWFDKNELSKFDEQKEPLGQLSFDSAAPARPISDASAQRPCPKCPRMMMMRHFFSIKRDVELDECAKCGGIWLDSGELTTIRHSYKDEQERLQAADAFLNGMVADLSRGEREKTQKFVSDANRVANALKFICPSYYIPGKQKGGAF